MLNVFPSLQLADLSAILSLATFASCGVSGGDGEYSHLQQDFVSRGMLTWVMSVKLLWKALGSNHRMFVVQWRMQLSLSGLLPWMIGPTDHTQKHIGNFARVWLGCVGKLLSTLSSQRANQISILPGQSKSFNYIWPIGSSSISLPQPSPTEEFITSTSSKASSASSN